MILYAEYPIRYYVSMCFSFLLFGIRIRVAEHSGRGNRTGFTTKGDIIIGGLIPVHFSPNDAPHPGNSSCSGSFHIRGYKGVEAMLYAVNLINDNPKLLPGVTLGVDIKDTCGSVNYAIMESLSFDFIRNAFAASEQTECNKILKSSQSAAGGSGERFNESLSQSRGKNQSGLLRISFTSLQSRNFKVPFLDVVSDLNKYRCGLDSSLRQVHYKTDNAK